MSPYSSIKPLILCLWASNMGVGVDVDVKVGVGSRVAVEEKVKVEVTAGILVSIKICSFSTGL